MRKQSSVAVGLLLAAGGDHPGRDRRTGQPHRAVLLDDLLDVRRITHNRLQLRRQRVELMQVIAAALETSQPLIESGRPRALVELHDGSIDAHSEGPGRGSEFVVTLPLAQGEAPAPPTADSLGDGRATQAHPRRIVVVDDNCDAAESLAILLRMLGNEVDLAHDGHAAYSVLERVQPDAALLDIGLPIMDGYEVARRIRAQPWGAAIMLIALTGWGKEEDKRQAREAGFDHHLTKPVDFEELKQILFRGGNPGV